MLGSQYIHVCLMSVCKPNSTSSHTRLASRIAKLHCLTSVCQPNLISSHTRLASRNINLIDFGLPSNDQTAMKDKNDQVCTTWYIARKKYDRSTQNPWEMHNSKQGLEVSIYMFV